MMWKEEALAGSALGALQLFAVVCPVLSAFIDAASDYGWWRRDDAVFVLFWITICLHLYWLRFCC